VLVRVNDVSAGTRVEVVNRFTASWSRGFVVAEVLESGYRVERLSDGCVLPAVFSSVDVGPVDQRVLRQGDQVGELAPPGVLDPVGQEHDPFGA
jgi:hypothetical protein